jgi:hypothetical protein
MREAISGDHQLVILRVDALEVLKHSKPPSNPTEKKHSRPVITTF